MQHRAVANHCKVVHQTVEKLIIIMCKVSSSVLLLAAAIGMASGIVDYCPQSKELCKYTTFDQHITCGATGDLLASCPSDARTVDLTNENIQQIVDLHNQYRNKIAGGNEPRFSSASKMTTMVSEALLFWTLLDD